MLFTSYEFIGFYVLLLALYYVVPKKMQWGLLLAASCLFYAAANPKFLLYILGIAVLTYLAARLIDANHARQKEYLKEHKEELDREEKKAYKSAQDKIRRRWLALCLVFVLGILGFSKYTNFFIANVNSVLRLAGSTGRLSFVNVLFPLGISFYTFQAISYLIDVYRETIPVEKNFFRYALFVSFFPLLIQGPISRFGDLAKTLWSEHAFSYQNVRDGLFRVLWGFFKKLVVADRLLIAVGRLIGDADTYRGAYAVVILLFYTIELYADFTGGIDVTIGIAQTFGVEVKENFMRPYFSKSLKEYWRRWHISMCTWFKDYLFYPVSASRAMRNISKAARKLLGERVGKRLPVYLSSAVVWFMTGIWHGASWNFVVWGMLNCAVLMISEELEPLYLRFHKRFSVGGRRWYRVFQIGRTFLLICVLNLFDCYTGVGTTFRELFSVFGARNWKILWDGSLLALGLAASDYAVLLIGILLMLAVSLVQRGGSVRAKLASLPYALRAAIWFGLGLAVLLWGTYGIGYDSAQFIYNQF